MATRQTAIRAAAIAMLAAGGGMFVLQSGLLPGVGNAQPAPQQPSVPVEFAQAPAAPIAPAVLDTPDVALPEQALRPVPVAIDDVVPDQDTPELIEVAATPAEAIAPVNTLDLAAEAVLAPVPADTDIAEDAVSPFGLPCDVSVTTTAMPGAIVALDILAPCQPEARIVVEHSAMTVTGQTDALGLMTMDIPAFESPAFFTVQFPDGEEHSSLVTLPDLPDYDRVAVQWSDDRQLALHAIPLGVEFGAPGHIWRDAPGDLADAQDGTGGALLQIGSLSVENPMLAQVFTFPHASLSDGDVIELSIDAPVTETTCGQPVEAITLEMTRAGAVTVTPITLTLPSCEAVGDYLVLQNLFQDLTVAAN